VTVSDFLYGDWQDELVRGGTKPLLIDLDKWQWSIKWRQFHLFASFSLYARSQCFSPIKNNLILDSSSRQILNLTILLYPILLLYSISQSVVALFFSPSFWMPCRFSPCHLFVITVIYLAPVIAGSSFLITLPHYRRGSKAPANRKRWAGNTLHMLKCKKSREYGSTRLCSSPAAALAGGAHRTTSLQARLFYNDRVPPPSLVVL